MAFVDCPFWASFHCAFTTIILIINKLMVVFFYLAFILSLNKLSGAVDLATGFTA